MHQLLQSLCTGTLALCGIVASNLCSSIETGPSMQLAASSSSKPLMSLLENSLATLLCSQPACPGFQQQVLQQLCFTSTWRSALSSAI